MQRNPLSDVETEVPCRESASTESGGPTALDGTRRGLLVGAGLVGVAGAVAACGGSGERQTSGGASGTVLGKVSEIPVGGGKVFIDYKIVVTQPEKGTFKAFSAICTHRGCTVNVPPNGSISCACHGAMYKISDASVVAGPASAPLPDREIRIEGDQIKLA